MKKIILWIVKKYTKCGHKIRNISVISKILEWSKKALGQAEHIFIFQYFECDWGGKGELVKPFKNI